MSDVVHPREVSRILKKEKMLDEVLLPCEVWNDILSRVPLNGIAKFKCVSKSCCALIDNPVIADMLLKRSHNSPKLMVAGQIGELYSIDCNDESKVGRIDLSIYGFFVNDHFYVWGSRNGLLGISMMMPRQDEHYLWNPCTYEYRSIPSPPWEIQSKRPWERTTLLLFGCGSAVNDYKVLSVHSDKSKAMVYSFRSNSWTRIKDVPYNVESTYEAVLVAGAFHWVAEKDGSQIVIAYEMETEKVVEVPLPVSEVEGRCSIKVAAIDECLCVVFWSRPWSETWIMKNYGVTESWTKLIHVKGPLIPLCSIKNGAEILGKGRDTVCVYNRETQEIRPYAAEILFPGRWVYAVYVESIVRVSVEGRESRKFGVKPPAGLRNIFIRAGKPIPKHLEHLI